LAALFLYPHLGILAPRFSKEAKMSDIAAIHNTWLAAEAGEALRRIGVGVFAFAMVALGVETLISARDAAQVLGASIQRYSSDSVAACDFLARLPVRSSVGGLRRGTSIAAHSASGCAHFGLHAACLRARSRRSEKRREYWQHIVAHGGV
jgi:hypothetical protein